MAFGLGPAEVLILLLLSSGGSMPDAVSIFPAGDYFKMRGIETTQAKMMELAGTEPKTAKAQIQQLQALRVLASDPKLEAATLALVRDVAMGKRANDKQGFAKKYAQKVLASVGENVEPVMVKAKAAEALEWFPADATLAAVVDFRLARIPGFPQTHAEPAIWKIVPEKVKRQILEKAFEVLEETGNVEVYRGSMAMAEGNNGLNDPRLFARFSGRFNQEWLVAAVKKLTPAVIETAKGAGGETYQYMEIEGVALALMNDSEFFLAGQFDRGMPGAGPKRLQEMLEIKAGKKDSVLKGKHLKDLFAKVPPAALGLFVMELNAQAKGVFAFLGDKVHAPDKVVLFATPAFKAIDIQFEGMMQNGDHAKTTVKGIGEFRDMGIQLLKQIEGKAPIPGFSSRPFIQLLESLQVEPKADSVHVRLLLPEDVIRSIVDMMMRAFPANNLEGRAAPPARRNAA